VTEPLAPPPSDSGPGAADTILTPPTNRPTRRQQLRHPNAPAKTSRSFRSKLPEPHHIHRARPTSIICDAAAHPSSLDRLKPLAQGRFSLSLFEPFLPDHWRVTASPKRLSRLDIALTSSTCPRFPKPGFLLRSDCLPTIFPIREFVTCNPATEHLNRSLITGWCAINKSSVRFGISMARKRSALSLEKRTRDDHANRLRRFAKQFDRWSRGEPVLSYEAKWLAYLKEHQSSRGQRPRETPAHAAEPATSAP
jgi:hypothetical protein